ncbi:hypothetical protein [Cellulosimicrobium sp. NPDC057127]|uniref:hypothetical protein n=1 Tax=Cellulosimicrobium sp. NPDC057127 TaxID=3346026 RepID=UPI0036272D83
MRARGRTAPRPDVGTLAETVSAAVAGAGTGGRVGVCCSDDPGSAVLLDLAVREVGRARVVALVSLGPDATADRRCAVAQAAHAAGVATFDLRGSAVDDAVRTLELSAVVVADGPDDVADPVDGLPGRLAEHGATTEDAVQVEAAESELRRLGLDLRVRHHGDLARLEAPRSDLVSVASEPLRGEVLRAVRSAGFRAVALDLGRLPGPSEG